MLKTHPHFRCFNPQVSVTKSPRVAHVAPSSRCRARVQRPGRPGHDLGSAADGAAGGRAVLGQAPVPWKSAGGSFCQWANGCNEDMGILAARKVIEAADVENLQKWDIHRPEAAIA